MSKIDEMIEHLCPDGVEYRSIDKVATGKYGKGNKIPADGGIYPVYGCYGIVGSTATYNNENTPIVGHIGSAGKVTWGDGKHFVTYNGTICKPINSGRLLSKYLFYCLQNIGLERYVKGNQPFLSFSDFKNIKIPVPPLEIQEEIVRVLDSFAELEAKLEAELEAELERHKAQYVYYRDQLLDFKNENVLAKSFCSNRPKYRQLKDIASYVKSKIDVESLPASSYVGVEDLKKNFQGRTACNIERRHSCSATEYIPGDILLGNIRPYLKKMWLSDSYGGASGDVLVIRPNDQKEIMSKFLWYCLTTDDFVSFIVRHSRGGKMPRGDKKMIMNYFVPVPPLEVQQCIVDILDKFDALVNDISQGLPAEIEARRKQYEYYRDKLLTFKEKVD